MVALIKDVRLFETYEDISGRFPGRLGRKGEHDERSRAFAERENPVFNIEHTRYIPILDQGNLGSCTGNAGTGALGSGPLYQSAGRNVPALDESFAADYLYHNATLVDEFPGGWPVDDTGSSGLAVAKVLTRDKFIAGYTHAFSLNAALSGTNKVPTIWGIHWYEGFDSPDADGLVKIAGDIRGGHEVCCRVVDIVSRTCLFDNSWGASWGLQGSFRVGWDDLGRLLDEDGDCTIFTSVDKPAPTPTPVDNSAAAKLVKAHDRYNKYFDAWRKEASV